MAPTAAIQEALFEIELISLSSFIWIPILWIADWECTWVELNWMGWNNWFVIYLHVWGPEVISEPTSTEHTVLNQNHWNTVKNTIHSVSDCPQKYNPIQYIRIYFGWLVFHLFVGAFGCWWVVILHMKTKQKSVGPLTQNGKDLFCLGRSGPEREDTSHSFQGFGKGGKGFQKSRPSYP